MPTLKGLITVNDLWVINTDTDPSTSGGITAPLGSLSLAEDGSGMFYKSGAGATAWNILALGGSGVTTFNSRSGAVTLSSSDVTTALTYTPLNLAGGTMTGNLILNGDATLALQAVTFQQFNSAIQGLTPKPTAKVATTTALPSNTYSNGTAGVGATLTGTTNATLSAIDTYAPQLGDVILVMNEATGANNGLYTVTQVGSVSLPYILTRHVDMDSSTEFVGAYIPVSNAGSVNKNSIWLCNSTTPFTTGTTSVIFTQLNGATDLIQGAGITISGNTISITTAGVTNVMLAGSITASKLVGTDITTVGTITTGTWNGSVIGSIHGGTGVNNTGTLTYGSNNITFTTSGTTTLTLPTSGTVTALGNSNTGTGVIVLATSPILITPTLGVATATSLTVTGTAGGGYLELQSQSVAPSVGPTNSVRMFSNAGLNAWINKSDGFVRTLDGTLTANRTYTLPDASITLIGRTGTNAATQLAFFNDANQITSTSTLVWNGTGLGIGATTPTGFTFYNLGATRLEPVSTVTYDTYGATVTTIDATQTTINTIATTTGKIYMITAKIVTKKLSGAGAGSVGDGNAYIRTCKVKNVSGTLTLSTIQSDYTQQDIAGLVVAISISGSNIIVQVTGLVSDTLVWNSIVNVNIA